METVEFLKMSILSQFFNYDSYENGVARLKSVLSSNKYYQDRWAEVKSLINNRELEKGVPLDLIHNSANLPLYENTEDEAYRWLNLMIKNVESDTAIIIY